MNYTIKVNKEKKFIHYTHVGVLKRVDVGDVWKKIIEIDEFTNQGYNLLSDYRDAKFDFGVDCLATVIEFFDSIKSIINGKKQAVICDSSHETMVTMLFENDKLQHLNFKVKAFSTEAAAIRYLL